MVKITVSEGSIKRHLKLEDSKGIPSLSTAEIFEQLALMGAPSTSQPPITPIEEAAPMPHESPLHRVYSLRRDERSMQQHELMDLVTKLIDKIGVLEKDLQHTNKTYKDEDAGEDSSKQGKKIFDIDTDPTISLVQPQQDMEYDFDITASIPVTTDGLEISTANIAVSIADVAVTTASASISTVSPLRVSTAEDISGAKTLVYIRRSASKAKDREKAIMQESEPPKKIKKRVQVQMSIDEELAKKLDEREEVADKEAHDIDWSDPSGGYKLSHFKGEKGSEKKTGERRKKSLARKRARETLSKESAKKQKLEDDAKKEGLQVYLNIVPEEESLDVESLSTKYLIVDWET
ncbi:hypothetical protein Tco_0483952 [Tanacetum coccineum]